MKTYVVINHYILSSYLEELAIQCITSFKETHDCIIVSVDDNSPIKSDKLKELSDIWIQRETNGGFAVSANTGLQWILDNEKDDCYIVYSNNDIKVFPNWYETFLKYDFDMIGGLGYRNEVAFRKENNYSEGGRYNDWMFPGGFFMTTKKVLEEIGLYDENYLHGGIEDIDLFYRAKNAGIKLIITPNVSYWHREGATRYSNNEKDKQSIAIKKNEEYFVKKWGFDPIKELYSKILIENRINL